MEVDGKGIPMRYLQIDSYWYYKVGGGVSNWTATPEAFPGGLKKLSADTNWTYVAHNRYWSPAVAYAKQNGGQYDFIIEKGHNAIPTSQAFWDYLMASSKEWGMAVYEQDWLHNEWEGMSATLTSATLSTRIPTTCASDSITTMRLKSLISDLGKPKRVRVSITVTTLPRRFMIPRT